MRDRPSPIHFEAGHGPGFAWYHAPALPARDLGVVLCAPIGSELMCSYYPLRELASTLAHAGIAVLRADYHGTGDASGDDAEPERVRAWLATIDRSIDALRARGCVKIALVGVRIGATLAAITASRRNDIAALVLWAPLRNGHAYAREMKLLAQAEGSIAPEQQAIDEGAIEAGGFLLSAATVRELAALDLRALAALPARSLLIGRDDIAGNFAWAQALGVECVDWPGYAGMMLAPHYARPAPETFAKIVAWLAEDAAPASRQRPFVASEAEVSVELAGGVREIAFRFGEGQRLFGVLTQPTAAVPARMAVLMANTGANHHIGANRIHVRAARDWASRGFSVLRFDLGGIGESEPAAGAPCNAPFRDGGIDDFESALAELRRRTGASTIVSVGICSGAYVSFHAALRGAALSAQVLINPAAFYWKEGDSLDVAPSKVAHLVRAYRKSALSRASWKKLLSGQAGYRALARTLALRAYHLAAVRLKRTAIRLGLIMPVDDLAHDLRAIGARGVATLLVYSEGDPGIGYLEERVGTDLARLERAGVLELATVAGADHTFTAQAAQGRLIETVTAYLERHA